jgi:hypothetical protein
VIGATANLKNPTQQAASMEAGMNWMQQQGDFMQNFWGQWAAGGPPMDQNWLGQSSTDNSTSWWDFAEEAGWTPPP